MSSSLTLRDWAVLHSTIFPPTRNSGKVFQRHLDGVTPIVPSEHRARIRRRISEIRSSGKVSENEKKNLLKLLTIATLKNLKLWDILQRQDCDAVCANREPMSVPIDVLQLAPECPPIPNTSNGDVLDPGINCTVSSSAAVEEASWSNLGGEYSGIQIVPLTGGQTVRTANLTRFAEDYKGKVDLSDIINHVGSKHNFSQAGMTELLTAIDILQPQVDYNQKNPITAGTIRKVAPELFAPVHVIDESTFRPRGDGRKGKIQVQKTYARFGVENVLVYHSPGQIYATEHVNALYAAACIDDSWVSHDLKAYLDPLGSVKKQLYDVRGLNIDAEHDDRCPRKGLRRMYTIKGHDVETCFWVDIHIDDVSIFENSTNGAATPIQMRVFGVGTREMKAPLHVIPMRESKPSVIGFYHGNGKLDLDFFTRSILFEFRRLHPCTDPDNPKYLIDPETGHVLDKRKCCVRIRCCLADTKGRHGCRNTKHSGYNSCERCWDLGVQLRKKDIVRLVRSDAKLKMDSDWDLFPTHRWDPEEDDYVETSHWFRRPGGFDPFGSKPRILHPLTDFALDGMHNVGGGATRRLFECLFAILPASKTNKASGQCKRATNAMNKANEYLEEWIKPKEFAREVRKIQDMKYWKMREGHDALLYHLVALLGVPEIRQGVGEPESDTAMCLVTALQLIYHTTHEKPSDYDIDEAEILLKTFFDNFVEIWTGRAVSYKIHCLLHLANECRIHQAHLGSFDAYPFENWLGEISKGLVKTGKNVVQQFVDNVTNNAGSQLPLDRLGCATNHQINIDAIVDEMIHQRTLNLPATTIELVDIGKQKVQCSGFECSIKYPDNVLVIRDEDRTEQGYRGNEHVHILVVTGFRMDDDGRLLVRGCVFRRPREAHSACPNNIRYLALNLLGLYEAYKYELCADEYEFDFQDMVIGKCFPYHMELTKGESDANPVGENCARNQWWIFQREMHSRIHQTLTKRNTGKRRRK